MTSSPNHLSYVYGKFTQIKNIATQEELITRRY